MILAIDTNCILPGKVGGIESYVASLIEAILRHGYWLKRLVLVNRPENQALFSRYSSARCEAVVVERPTFRGRPVSNWPALIAEDAEAGAQLLRQFQAAKEAALRTRGVEVIHFPSAAINPLHIDLPVVVTIHDLQHRRFAHYFSAAEIENRERWWPASARRAEAVVTDSDYVADDVRRQFGLTGSKLFVAAPAVQERFLTPPGAGLLEQVRQQLGLHRAFLLYPAAAFAHKNHARLIRAFLAAELSEVQLVLTGAGQTEAKLPDLLAALSAGSRVRLLGQVSGEQLLGLYHLALGLVFPSEYEGCGQPVLEAMACRCPVAASNVTSLPELVGDAGVMFDPADERDMTEAIQRLVRDEALWFKLIERGQRRIAKFTPQRFVDAIHAAYRFALATEAEKRAA